MTGLGAPGGRWREAPEPAKVPALPERFDNQEEGTLHLMCRCQGNANGAMVVMTRADYELAVRLAWEAGRDYQPEGLAEALDDARHATIDPPRLSYEERVQQRITEMEQAATTVRLQIEDEHAGASRRPWGWSS